MSTTKREKLSIIEKHPDFIAETLLWGAQSLLRQLRNDNFITPRGKKLPNNVEFPRDIVVVLYKDWVHKQLDLNGELQ